MTSATSQQKLLFVHQTAWQKRLLTRYGNDICLLDATYKTTRYALPLFFLAVKTNVDYQVVGSFVIQDESTDSIKEALNILKDWNPYWSPNYFMTDFSNEEISAIEETFSGILLSKGLYIHQHLLPFMPVPKKVSIALLNLANIYLQFFNMFLTGTGSLTDKYRLTALHCLDNELIPLTSMNLSTLIYILFIVCVSFLLTKIT